jgi:predicted O-methyltransferase YrrM
VEFGSGFGYSVLWIALACGSGCTIHCIDYQERNRQRALNLFSQFELKPKIFYHVGEALTVFNDLDFKDESLDLVVFDHEKQNYSESLELVLPKLRKGGLIIADDVLWKGKVTREGENSIRVNALRFFLKEIFHRRDLSSFVCPLGDGVAVIQKLF